MTLRTTLLHWMDFADGAPCASAAHEGRGRRPFAAAHQTDAGPRCWACIAEALHSTPELRLRALTPADAKHAVTPAELLRTLPPEQLQSLAARGDRAAARVLRALKRERAADPSEG